MVCEKRISKNQNKKFFVITYGSFFLDLSDREFPVVYSLSFCCKRLAKTLLYALFSIRIIMANETCDNLTNLLFGKEFFSYMFNQKNFSALLVTPIFSIAGFIFALWMVFVTTWIIMEVFRTQVLLNTFLEANYFFFLRILSLSTGCRKNSLL